MRLADKAIFYTFARFSSQAVRILILMVLSRLLSKTDYGSYRQIWLLSGVIATCFTLGLPYSCFYFIPRLEKNEQKTFIYQVLILLSLMGVLVSAGLYLGADLFSRMMSNAELANLIRIYSPAVFASLVNLAFAPILLSIDRSGTLGLLMNVFIVLKSAATIIPAYGGASLSTIFLWIVISSLVENFTYIWIIWRAFRRVRMKSTPGLVRKQISFGLPIGFSNIFSAGGRYLDQFAISFFYSPAAFATYANGNFELPFVGVATESVLSVITPNLVKYWGDGQREQMLNLWHESIRKIALFMLPLMSFFLIFSREAIIVLFSSAYVESAQIFRILLLLIPHTCTLYLNIIMYLGYPKTVMKLTILDNLTTITLVLILLSVFGYLGPPIAKVVSTYGLAILYVAIIKKKTGVTWAKVYPWFTMFRMIGVSLLLAGLLSPLKLLSLAPFFTLFLGGSVYVVLIFIGFRKMGLLTPNDIDQIKRWMNPKAVLKLFKKQEAA